MASQHRIPSPLIFHFHFSIKKMWTEQDNKLCRSFKFADFRAAFLFMTQVAEVAEAQNHHPWWSNMYNEVTIKLSTHDAGDVVTEKDRKLAASIDVLLENRPEA